MNIFTESQIEAAIALRQDILEVLNGKPRTALEIEELGGTLEAQTVFYEMVEMAARALTTLVGDVQPDDPEMRLSEIEMMALPFLIHSACQDAPFESVGTFRSAFGRHIGMGVIAMASAVEGLSNGGPEIRFGLN